MPSRTTRSEKLDLRLTRQAKSDAPGSGGGFPSLRQRIRARERARACR